MANIKRLQQSRAGQQQGRTGIDLIKQRAMVQTPSTPRLQQIGQSETSQGRKFKLPPAPPTRNTVLTGQQPVQPTTTADLSQPSGRLNFPLAGVAPTAPGAFDLSQPAITGGIDLTTPEGIREFTRQQALAQIEPTLGVIEPQTQDAIQRAQDEILRLQQQLPSNLVPIEDQPERFQLLNRLGEAQKSAIARDTEMQLEQLRDQTAGAQEQLATRFGFAGFGQSTQQQAGQADLLKQQQQIESSIRAQQALENAKIDAEIRGASLDEIERIEGQIQAQRDQVSALQAGLAETQANLRLEALGVAESATADMLEQLGVGADAAAQANLEASATLGFLVDDFGQPILNDAGNVVSLPDAVKQQFVAATTRQGAGVFNPITGQFTPLDGVGRAGLLGGGGVGTGVEELGFDPTKTAVYDEILGRVVRGEALDISDAIKESDLAASGKRSADLLIETTNYQNALIQAQQEAAAQQPVAPPRQIIPPESRLGGGLEAFKGGITRFGELVVTPFTNIAQFLASPKGTDPFR